MSKLNSTSLTLNNKEIKGIETTLTADDTKIPTSKALYEYLKSKKVKPFAPTSLSVSGYWANLQYNKTRPDLTGLIFTATYADGSWDEVSDINVSPITWNTEGPQTATFSYTIKGVTQTTGLSVSVNRTLESLSVSGNWSNVQFYNEAPDTTGLTFTATYNNDDTATVTPSVSPSVWGGTGTQTATFSYTEGPYSASTTKTANVVRKLIRLDITGNWTNPQFYNTAIDTTGLTFKAVYNNGDEVTVTPSVSPSVWGGTGTQTATFSYTENGITVSNTKTATVVRKLTSLSVSGSWSNPQFYNTAIDTTGLTFTASYNNNTSATVTPIVSPSVWGGTGTQTATFSYTENGITVSNTKNATVVRKLTSLSVSGNWSKTQYTNTAVDYTGLTFTASYNNGTTATVTPSVSPGIWSGTVGSQTATFSYTENGITKTTTKTATVVRMLTGLSVSGSWSKTQWTNTAVDITGLTFTASYNNETTATVTPSVSPGTWSSTAGTQTATFSYTENGITKTTTKAATVYRMLTGLSVSGSWSNTQHINTAVDYTGLTFTASYNNGTTATVTPSSYSPTTWGSTAGTQTCTFYYSENGIEVSANKSANVADYWVTVPLTLYARESGNVSIVKTGDPGTIYYSKNGGSQTVLDSNVNISVSAGDRVSFYRTLSGNLGYGNYFTIACTNNCYVYGNIMSLYNKNNFVNLTTVEYNYAFCRLFKDNAHININESVGKLVLPATTLASYCYSYMFGDCSSLITAPALPATTLASYCYHSMFSYCSSLTTAPALPATTLAAGCYYNMFDDSSLTTAPVLPATTLAEECYGSMFRYCKNLTTAPVLPATTLTKQCYAAMFYKCTSLTSITCLATDISAERCTYIWASGVASSGTFYKNSVMSSWTTGGDGIPSGWTVRDA